jgi:hypothetical protein
LILADFAVVVMTATLGIYAGQYVRKWPAAGVVVLVAVAIGAQATASASVGANFARPGAMSSFAANWDREDLRIRQGAIIGRPLADPGDDGTEATIWQIKAARAFYGRAAD